MSKVRIYQLAKDLDIKSTDLLAILADLGVEAKSHASTIDETTAQLVVDLVKKTASTSEQPTQMEEPSLAPDEPVPTPEPTPQPVILQVEEPPVVESPPPPPPSPEPDLKTLTIPPMISLRELADKVQMEPNRLVAKLIELKVLCTVNQTIPSDLASRLLESLGFRAKIEVPSTGPKKKVIVEDDAKMTHRPPVVTVMGHVDHGKTKLLDAIRKTNVIDQEAGGITQRIGASEVVLHDQKRIVFLDTPGHEAFTSMRARGAQITDLAILVVAADDGVMPQTIEAVDHARAAGVPIIVAINKIDKPEANVDRVKHQLSEMGLAPEDWGGDTICVSVSAKQNQGIEDLLEMILLVAEMAELKANPHAPASGTVIEARVDQQKGPTATVLVQRGTLRVGDSVVMGAAHGKIRNMVNWKNQPVHACSPSGAVSIFGLSSVPEAGEHLKVVKNTKTARQVSADQVEAQKEDRFKGAQRVRLDGLFTQIQEGIVKDLKLVVKADVRGSAEALCQALRRLDHPEVRVTIIHQAVGNINESDIMLASASNAVVIGFDVQLEPNARVMADREKIDVRTYDIIYNIINDIKAAIEGMLEPIYVEKKIGEAEVRALFKASRIGTIAGCLVLSGRITADATIKVIRNKELMYTGKIRSLRHVKEVVKEVVAGTECGINITGFDDVQEGDILQAVIMEEITRTLDSPRPKASTS